MHFDGRYPDVSLADWSTFEECFDRLSYTAVLNRYDAGLMPWFFPLARGVIVAASQMERKLFPALRFPRHFVEERERAFGHMAL